MSKDRNYYKVIHYDVKMEVIGAALDFSIWYEGKRLDAVLLSHRQYDFAQLDR